MLYRGFIVVAETEAEAERLASTFVPPTMAASIEANKRHQLGGNGASALPEDWARRVTNGKPDQGPIGFGLGPLLFAGTPDTIVERIRGIGEPAAASALHSNA